jgi:aspartate kinase
MRPGIVMKFGGTSVGTPAAIRKVGAIVAAAADRRPLVVVSAMGGVTNDLYALVKSALSREPLEERFQAVARRHKEAAEELEVDFAPLAVLCDELRELARGVALLGECTPRAHDRIASLGERLSARLVAGHLARLGLPALAVDAWDAGLLTDRRFQGARPLPSAEASIRAAVGALDGLPVVTGYIGRSAQDEITTLGRGGSDYSAAIFGAALGVEEIQIWTDVDGVMTADPRKTRGARRVAAMSFAEAAELAFFGAKVLHPATMQPAVKKGIPIRVLNTFAPGRPGTVVAATNDPSARGVKSIATKDRIAIVNVVASEMQFQWGFLAKIANAFERREVVVDAIATSEVSVALTTDADAPLDLLASDLRQHAEVEVIRDVALVSIVGEELRDRRGFAAEVFATLAELSVSPRLVSYGATGNNLSFVVDHAQLPRVVEALHAQIFEERSP